ncbi:hypothetical protein Tco_0577840 [Tanacetum coccineum]
MFEDQAKQELFETVKPFHACKQEDGQLVSSYILNMKSYLDTLELLGYPMPNEHVVSLIFNSLNKDYEQFVQNYNMHSIGKTIVELHVLLKLTEKGLPKKNETTLVLSIRGGNGMRASIEAIGSIDLTLPNGLSFWGYALESDARILSMVPTKKVDKTPYEIWNGKAPNLSHLKETIGYYFYNPHENKIFVACYAEFFENSLTLQEASRSHTLHEESGSHTLHEESGSDVGLKLLQELDTQPSYDSSEQHDEVEHMDVEPHSEKVPICRFERISDSLSIIKGRQNHGYYSSSLPIHHTVKTRGKHKLKGMEDNSRPLIHDGKEKLVKSKALISSLSSNAPLDLVKAQREWKFVLATHLEEVQGVLTRIATLAICVSSDLI